MDTVIVAGGGPVALMVAAELRLADVPVTVLERGTERSPHSKALTLHPRTLELLTSRGIADRFLAEGLRVPSGHFAALDSRLDLTALDTPHPFTLMLPQVRTEELLEEHARALGAEIRYGHTVTGLSQNTGSVSVHVRGPHADTVLECAYLVGADGASSTVRRAAGIGFPGTPSTLAAFLVDAVLDDPPGRPGYTVQTDAGLVMAVPLPDGAWRFVGIDADQPEEFPAPEPAFEDVRASVARITGTDFGMREPRWTSLYGNAARIADTYRLGRVLLAGDAAHMHFPAGGQGLNVGLQDAVNLGWRLALRIRGRGGDALLDRYDAERRPVGTALLESTRAQTQLLWDALTDQGRSLRSLLSSLIRGNPDLHDDLAARLAALDVRYPPETPDPHPLVGTRAPDLDTEDGRGLMASLAGGRHLLLDTTGGALARGVAETAAFPLDVRPAPRDRRRPAWSDVRAALVRPDGHVAWVGTDTDDDALARDASAALHLP